MILPAPTPVLPHGCLRVACLGRRNERLYASGVGVRIGATDAPAFLGISAQDHKANLVRLTRSRQDILADLRERSLACVRKIRDALGRYGVELIVIVNPQYAGTLLQNGRGHAGYLEDLAHITPYYCFAGLHWAGLNERLFTDRYHYVGAVGDMIVAD